MVHGLETLKRLNEEQKAKEEAMATAALHEYFARLDREREESFVVGTWDKFVESISYDEDSQEVVPTWVSNHVIPRTRPDILQFVEYCYDGDIVSQITIDLDKLCVLLYNPETEIEMEISFEEIEELEDSLKEFAKNTLLQLEGKL